MAVNLLFVPGRPSRPAWLLGLMIGLLLGAFWADLRPKPQDLSPYPWFYLRDGHPSAPNVDAVELILVGDLMLGRGVASQADPLGSVAPWLRAADLALGNFEGVLVPDEQATQGQPGAPAAGREPQDPYLLLIPTEAPGLLYQAGFDLLGLANNHSQDRGLQGLAETAAGLAEAGIIPLGARIAADEPVLVEVKGLRLAFVAINFVPGASGRVGTFSPRVWEREQAAETIRRARDQAQVVVASVHWGYEYQTQPDPYQRDLADELLAAGADLVVGHHPHVVQSTRVAPASGDHPSGRDRFVAYSLGNFVFDQYQEEARRGLALRVWVDTVGLQAVQALPVWAGARPRLMPMGEAANWLKGLLPSPDIVGYVCGGEDGCRPASCPQTGPDGRFRKGSIDLTGDGHPEQVTLGETGVAVTSDGVQVWESPADWQVLDLALGDPNDDGRAELILALDKADPSGVLRSHPFVVGYRGGEYRVLWGGSAVAQSLREVELFDLDGDRSEELLVLEAQGDTGLAALTLWRWNGWGFSLLWRGPPGRFRDLSLSGPDGAGTPLVCIARTWP